MGAIGIALIVILIVSAVLLVLVVLVQDDQGEGLGGIFGGGSTTPFGSRSGNVLTRFTAILAAVFLVCIFGLAWVNKNPEAGNVISKARQESLAGKQQSWWVQTPAPATGGSGAPGAGTPLPGAQAPGAAPAPVSATPAPSTPASPRTGGN